ncbi:MAG: hypothetical protein AVDCRST_MAG02-4590 [uncultured Rubrobacteraceae bacterium]|uniref:Uncharacterized protein n=1 Tax=uncultured Rubrobacteraceae bacterium TaxID=349277 RepID=A0A6J4RN33_9ACTN|nr:MAG: hypothetical protein AVDCRST_MAG02-4590 [uncultured Rubrobacteraceae bacterium]
METSEIAKGLPAARAAALLFAVLLLLAACSEETGRGGGDPNRGEAPRETAASPTTAGRETTAEEPPKITLGEEPGGRPQVVLRLEGGPKTTFSGLCSVGGRQSVLGGRVPKRFTFDPGRRELSCRIEKRDDNRGALKIVLIAGDTTRSVQQTNSPGATINVTHSGG